MEDGGHTDERCSLRVRWDGHVEAHCYCWNEGEDVSIWAAFFPVVGIDGLHGAADYPAKIKLLEVE